MRAQIATAMSTRNNAGRRRRARRAQNAAKLDAPAAGPLDEQQRRDQVAREDEEHVDAEEAALRPVGAEVVREHREHRDRTQPVECGLVGEVRARRRGRRSGRRRGFDRFRRGGCHGINCVKTGLGGGYQRSTGNRRRRRCARPLEQCARYPLAGGDDRRGTGGRRARQRIASCEAPVVARSRNSGAPGVGHRRRGPAAADPGDDAEPRCADGRGLHARLPGSSPARSDPEPRLPPSLRSRQPVGAGGRLQGVWHRPVRGAVLRAVAAGGRGVRHLFDRPLVGPTRRGRVPRSSQW